LNPPLSERHFSFIETPAQPAHPLLCATITTSISKWRIVLLQNWRQLETCRFFRHPCERHRARLSFANPDSSAQENVKWTTESVLTKVDKSASDFRSLTADIEQIKYTDVVKDTSTETGQIFVRRDQKMRIDLTSLIRRRYCEPEILFSFTRPKSIASKNTTWQKPRDRRPVHALRLRHQIAGPGEELRHQVGRREEMDHHKTFFWS